MMEFGARHTDRRGEPSGVSGYSINPRSYQNLNPKVNHGDWLIPGTMDEILPVETTRAQMHMLREGGFNIDYREYPKTHTIDPNRELPDIQSWIADRAKL
jgi:predicted esterase